MIGLEFKGITPAAVVTFAFTWLLFSFPCSTLNCQWAGELRKSWNVEKVQESVQNAGSGEMSNLA